MAAGPVYYFYSECYVLLHKLVMIACFRIRAIVSKGTKHTQNRRQQPRTGAGKLAKLALVCCCTRKAATAQLGCAKANLNSMIQARMTHLLCHEVQLGFSTIQLSVQLLCMCNSRQ